MPGLGLGLGLDFLDAGTRTLKIPFLDEFSGAAAAYSLRDLKGGDPEVVRVRRSSDNAEDDFTATEVVDGTLENWVNTDVVQYTSDFTSGNGDLSEVNATGADGETIGGVSDAYKLTSSISGNPQTFKAGQHPDSNNTYSVSFDIYIPSSNSTAIQVDYLSPDSTTTETLTPTLDTWASYEFETVGGGNLTRWILISASIGDVFYLKNIVITQTTADGLVTTWYDQAGSNDATQATAASQPKIVDAGVLVEENGRPAVDFDGVDDGLEASDNASLDFTTMAFAGVFDIDGNDDTVISKRSSTEYSFDINGNSSEIRLGINDNIDRVILPMSGRGLVWVNYDKVNESLGINGGTLSNEPNTADITNSSASLWIGRRGSGFGGSTAWFDGIIQELILYPSNQSANRNDIETNINNHYNIYP